MESKLHSQAQLIVMPSAEAKLLFSFFLSWWSPPGLSPKLILYGRLLQNCRRVLCSRRCPCRHYILCSLRYLVRVELQSKLAVGFLEFGIRAGGIHLQRFVEFCFLDHGCLCLCEVVVAGCCCVACWWWCCPGWCVVYARRRAVRRVGLCVCVCVCDKREWKEGSEIRRTLLWEGVPGCFVSFFAGRSSKFQFAVT